MNTVALQQVSSNFARRNAKRTLEKPIGLKYVLPFLEERSRSVLEKTCKNGVVYVWGSKPERIHQTFKMFGRSSLVLFRRGAQIYKYGVVIEKVESEPLAESLWGKDEDGETWSTIYFFAKLTDKIIPAAQVNRHLARNPRDHWQGLVVLTMKDSEKVNEFFASNSRGSNK